MKFVLGAIVLCLSACSPHTYVATDRQCNEGDITTKTVLVTSVGGCDMNGWCGTLLSNGAKYDIRWPVVGQVISECLSQ